MCRESLCFKGITKLKSQWYREQQEEVYINLIEKIFVELSEDYSDILIECLEVVQNRFEYIMTKYPKISPYVLSLILGFTWMDIDYLLNVRQERIYEPRTYEKYLMVSKYEKKYQQIIQWMRRLLLF